ncbi:MAG: hypothetical protein VSS75_011385 [Candidatus Parabeggiatoa sp.]|nr:hypothetical protein [Candidatus Parabeggiatoa sp.]
MTSIKTTFLAIAASAFMTANVFAAPSAALVPAAQNNCFTTPWFSEEDSAREACDLEEGKSGYAVRGMNCKGSYCDDKQLYCCADGLLPLDPQNRIDSPYFSEEGSGSYLDKTRAMIGLACTGRYCDNISMTMQGFYTDPPPIKEFWTQGWFSEERGYDRCQRNGTEMGFVVGLACDGRYCDNLKLSCATYE